jgi:anaerobic selenocysteine-containing dehydrogenase
MVNILFEETGMKADEANAKKSEIREDVWIPTQCHRCQAQCGILAHRVNGVIVKLEGNPNSTAGSKGGLCSKGLAGLQLLYDPNRLKVPLRRTNPEKGIGVDPKWKEISWDEALDEIAARLKKVREEDPTKIMLVGGMGAGPVANQMLMRLLSTPKGHPINYFGRGIICGSAGHLVNQMFHGAFIQNPDWKRCNYQIQFGTNAGFAHFWQYSNRLALEAIERGMKLVVFDPVHGYAAAKATEWVPLIPGTDAAVCLAMLNVIVNDLGIYDAVFLKQKTNAPYLVGPDGHYVRDTNTRKPMVWDTTDAKAKIYNDQGIGDFALDGAYEVNGIKCCPAWHLLKERFKEYPPEKASEISGVPVATIRRIATEFAQAAQIGATITLEGKQYPLRPVGTLHVRGSSDHKNATNTVHAIELLTHILGASNVPGGNISVGAEFQGYSGTRSPHSEVCEGYDGYLINKVNVTDHIVVSFPPQEPRHPKLKDLGDLFVMAWDGTPILGLSDREEIWQKANIDPTIEVVIVNGRNELMSGEKPSLVEEFYKKMPFFVDFDIFANEFSEAYADILLPDASYFEYSDWGGISFRFHNQSPALDDPWCLHATQKVIEPMYNRRNSGEVVIDLMDRMGLHDEANKFLNNMLGFNEKLKLKPEEKVVWDELCNRFVVQNFGPEHDWKWFKEHGFISWPKKADEVYWMYLRDFRVPLYWEFLLDVGEKTKKITQDLGIELDCNHFSALPAWFPCPPHQVTDHEYDLYCIPYCDSLHVGSASQEQPWLDEASDMNPYTYTIILSADTAQRKGLKAGDTIEIESYKGNKVQGVLNVREGQHPQTVCFMSRGGHWASGLPIARGKGLGYQFLMDTRLSDCDPVVGHPEPCHKVKVTKVK